MKKNRILVIILLANFILLGFFVLHLDHFSGKSHKNREQIDLVSINDSRLPKVGNGEILLPENRYTYISNITYEQGYNESGNLNSLKFKDDADELKLVSEGTPGNYYMNITFRFGCNLTFEEYPPEYYDLYLNLYIDEPNAQSDSLVLKYLTMIGGSTFDWNTVKDENNQNIIIKDSEINISLAYIEKAFEFRIENKDGNPMNERKNITINVMRIFLSHKGSLDPIIESPFIYETHSLIKSGGGSDFNTWTVTDYDGDWNTAWDAKEIYGNSHKAPSPSAGVAWVYAIINLTCNHTPEYDFKEIVSISVGGESEFEDYGAASTNQWLILSLWNFTSSGTTLAEYYDITETKTSYTKTWDLDDTLDLDDCAIINADNITIGFRSYGHISTANPLATLDVYFWVDYVLLQIVVDGPAFGLTDQVYPHPKSDYPEIISKTPELIDTLGTFRINASITPKYLNDTIPNEKTYYEILNSNGVILKTDYMSDPEIDGLFVSDGSINALNYDNGVYTLLYFTEDSNGYGTYNITILNITNLRPVITIKSPLSTVFNLQESQIETNISVSDPEGNNVLDVEISLRKKGYASKIALNWIDMVIKPSNIWLYNITLGNIINYGSGTYELWFQASDAKGYRNTSMDVDLTLPTTSSPLPSADDDDSSSDDLIVSTLIWALIGSTIVGIVIVGFLVVTLYLFRQKKFKKAEKMKIKLENCPFCHKLINKKEKLCTYCGSNIYLKPATTGIDEKIIHLQSEEEYFENIFIQTSNILKIWIFDSKSKTTIYEESLDPSYSEIEKNQIDLTKILNEIDERNKFIEKSIEFNDNMINLYIYWSENPVIFILLSSKKLDKNYLEFVKKIISEIDRNYQNLSEDTELMKKLLDDSIFLFNSRKYNQVSTMKKDLLRKIFESEALRNSVLNEIPRLPIDTFEEFLELYKKLTEELKFAATVEAVNNIDYFKEGGYR